jgi:hypothetical protein
MNVALSRVRRPPKIAQLPRFRCNPRVDDDPLCLKESR